MNVEELKTLLERARQFSKENNGKVMMCSDRGIQALITVIERQQRDIDEIKAKFIS
jgi:hypothetical protein